MLESSRPEVADDANDHGNTGQSRNDAARAATPTASTASPNAVPVGTTGASIGSKPWASTVNHTRTCSAFKAKRRSQPPRR